MKPIDLRFSLCHASGCTAETEATKEIIEQMMKQGMGGMPRLPGLGGGMGLPSGLSGMFKKK